jgi:uroporphyrinogen decarboxylase
MTSKERVIRAITFKNPDRIPIDVWPVPAAYMRHGTKVDEMFEHHPLDFARPRWNPAALDPRFTRGTHTDEWGVVWDTALDGYFGIPVHCPLDDFKKLDAFKPPFDKMPGIADPKDVAAQPDKFHIALGSELFHRICWLRGMDKVFMDLLYEPPEIFRLRDMVRDYFAEQIKRQIAAGLDGVHFSDDFGSQKQLLISPELWRSFVRPALNDLVSICKEKGTYIFFHSDGYILDIIEDFIEMGVHALNAQVWCMGPKVLGKRFAGRIAFWGEINRQTTLPHGTPDDIREAARTLKKHLATPKGGLIGQGEIDGLTPLENIEALLTAWN